LSRSLNDLEGVERLLESLIKMVGKTNEKMDNLTKRVHQLETAAREQQYARVYSFIAKSAAKQEESERV